MEAEERLAAEIPRRRVAPVISEIILENFMSYEYGRIPLKQGLNIIAGPNGSGKSTLLLAISVALGQAYTERSRKLSDLIRRGKDIARVSLMFDNQPREGKRPVPFSRSDSFMLSRYLKSDGSYWYEADYREISKSEVTRLFRRFGLDPDNMLIIMHQGMVETFSITSATEKLKMVEEAVGFRDYREDILEAEAKLSGLISEESSLLQLLESAGQTLEYWKGVYEKFLQKKGLLEKKTLLERELVWSQVIKHEKTLQVLKERLEGRKRVLNDTIEQIEKSTRSADESKEKLDSLQTETRKLYFTLMRLEREKSEAQTTIKLVNDVRALILSVLSALERAQASAKDEAKKYFEEKIAEARYSLERLTSKAAEMGRKLSDLEDEIGAVQTELTQNDRKMEGLAEKYVTHKVTEGVLNFKRKNIEREIAEIEKGKGETQQALEQVLPEAEKAKPRIETERSPTEVAEEIRMTSVHVQALGEVSEEAEKIYSNFTSSYEDLKAKLAIVSENKSRALKELDERRRVWSTTIQKLVDEINPLYQEVLSKIGATGLARLVNTEDIETAGLELLVGFRGSPAVVLDAYTQSGGERGVAVMGFLLSIQESMVSPFRAVDEFDVHLDPKNREAVFKMILSYMSGTDGVQNVVITPSQLTVTEPTAHIIIVQNTIGKSEVKEVR